MSIIAKSLALLRWPDSQAAPLGGSYDVFRDNRDAAVDYGSAINPSPIAAWPDGAGKIGAGLGPAGSGPAGYGHGGVGCGMGGAGMGMAGFGAAMREFTTPPLLDGGWLFAVVASDPAGNAATPAAVEAAATLAGDPAPPGIPLASGYDLGTDTLTVEWPLSADDEG